MCRVLTTSAIRSPSVSRTDWLLLLAVAVALLLVIGFAVALLRRRSAQGSGGRHRPHRDSFRPEDAPPPALKRAAVVVNPTKFSDLADLEARLTAACLAHGWAEPTFHHTTAEDPGTGQAAQAVADGADVVCALGGDGTVRAVAQALAGTRTAMGLLPSGTGNLLARNMGLPLTSLEDAVAIALTGRNERVDVGRLTVDLVTTEGDHHEDRDFVFLVMAGMGFDAAIMGASSEELKAKVGWPAYVVGGLRNLRGDRFRATVTIGPEGHEEVVDTRARTIVVGNCGRIMGGITLMPEARIDDGLLDGLILSPATIAGWVAVTSRLLRQATTRNERVLHRAATRFVLRPDRPQEVQLDGDGIGPVHAMTAEVWPKALIVRMPVGQALPDLSDDA